MFCHLLPEQCLPRKSCCYGTEQSTGCHWQKFDDRAPVGAGVGSAASAASDDAASETADSENSSAEAFFDVDETDAASFVTARSSATMRSAVSSNISSLPERPIPGEDAKALELLLVAGSSAGGTDSRGDRQQAMPPAQVAVTLRMRPDSSEEASEASAGAPFGSEVVVQPLLIRAYLEGWDVAAQCVQQHLVAAGVAGARGGAPSGEGVEAAPADDASCPAQLSVRFAALRLEVVANIGGVFGCDLFALQQESAGPLPSWSALFPPSHL